MHAMHVCDSADVCAGPAYLPLPRLGPQYAPRSGGNTSEHPPAHAPPAPNSSDPQATYTAGRASYPSEARHPSTASCDSNLSAASLSMHSMHAHSIGLDSCPPPGGPRPGSIELPTPPPMGLLGESQHTQRAEQASAATQQTAAGRTRELQSQLSEAVSMLRMVTEHVHALQRQVQPHT